MVSPGQREQDDTSGSVRRGIATGVRDGRVALVTGAGLLRGIGCATAAALVEMGRQRVYFTGAHFQPRWLHPLRMLKGTCKGASDI